MKSPADDTHETDRRRQELLNDSNYGQVLCFLDRFRSVLNLPNYSFQSLEDHLIEHQDQIPTRLIDFHFVLLKRISVARNAQVEMFESIITKFAARYDADEANELARIGYLQANTKIKVRLIKLMLERQFDSNATFKRALRKRSACEIRPVPLGHDRFGGSYYLFMESNGFIRLFRESIDSNRTWCNVAKNIEELEQFIKVLVADSAVRKKFPDWIIKDERFSSVVSSNDFEQQHFLTSMTCDDDEPQIPAQRLLPVRITPMETKRKSPMIRTRRKKKKTDSSSSDSDEPMDESSDDDQSDEDPFQVESEEEMDSDDSQPRYARTAQSLVIYSTCAVCMKADQPDLIILCDDCNDGYHLECLNPMLFSIPQGFWFCSLCEHRRLCHNIIEKFQQYWTTRCNKIESIETSELSEETSMELSNISDEIDQSSSSETISYSISQRGRQRRTLFNMKEILQCSDDEDEKEKDVEKDSSVTVFDLHLPEKITRLLPASIAKIDQERKAKVAKERPPSSQEDGNDLTLTYLDWDNPCMPIKSLTTTWTQTSRLARQWHDVQRRSQLNSSNDSQSSGISEEDQIIPSKEIFARKKAENTFDQLTREIQNAMENSMKRSPIDPKPIKRVEKTYLSLYSSKQCV